MSGNAFLFRYEGREKRLYWRKQERKWRHMVQGVSRQVIVVRSPDPRLFEQAIFIVKENAFGSGVSADAVVQEAQRVARGYIRQNTKTKGAKGALYRLLYFLLGALLSSGVWGTALFLASGICWDAQSARCG